MPSPPTDFFPLYPLQNIENFHSFQDEIHHHILFLRKHGQNRNPLLNAYVRIFEAGWILPHIDTDLKRFHTCGPGHPPVDQELSGLFLNQLVNNIREWTRLVSEKLRAYPHLKPPLFDHNRQGVFRITEG